MDFLSPNQNRPATAASQRLHKAATWPTGPYESDLTLESTRSIGVTIHNPIPPCLTVETGSRSKSGFQRPDFKLRLFILEIQVAQIVCENAAETKQRSHSHRRASGCFFKQPEKCRPHRKPAVLFKQEDLSSIQQINIISKKFLHKQAQDTGNIGG